MRVIAGTARRLQLQTPPGLETRPTTDIQKETLFNILNPYLLDVDFLDLFAGSGAIGIEALSRGARYGAFVENNRQAIHCIKENLRFTKLEEAAEVFYQDVFQAIKSLESRGKVFDIIFMDPPYGTMIERQVLLALEKSTILNSDTIIIIEASIDTDFDYLQDSKFEISRNKTYKTNQHVFIEIKEK